jgi:hypothetical protein
MIVEHTEQSNRLITSQSASQPAQLYLLYVIDWNADREWNGGDIIVNDVFTHEQLLRWAFTIDMLHLAWNTDGICYYDGDDTFNCVIKNENIWSTIGDCKPDVQDRIFNAYIAAFDPSRMFIDKFVDSSPILDISKYKNTDWSDFCGNQSYCGYLRRLPLCV